MTFPIDLMITLIGYVILAFSYLGLGWASSRILRIDFPVKEKLFFLIWLGWAVTLFLLQIINLFIPINIFSNVPFLILGTIFAIVFLKNESWKAGVSNVSWVYPVLLAITTVWIAVLSMLSPRNNDSGLYHFNSIRWLNEYPIVLGLGNLHYRLAFNQSFFAYVAYLNLYPLFNHGYNLAISFLLLLLFAECLLFLSKLLNAKDLTENFRLISIIAVFYTPLDLPNLELEHPIAGTGHCISHSTNPDIYSFYPKRCRKHIHKKRRFTNNVFAYPVSNGNYRQIEQFVFRSICLRNSPDH